MKVKRYIIVILFLFNLILLFGCVNNKEHIEIPNSVEKVYEESNIENEIKFNESNTINIRGKTSTIVESNDLNNASDTNWDVSEESIIFGTWSLEKIALISEILMFPPDNEEDSSDLQDDAESYIGLELELNKSYFRLADKEILSPNYSLEYMTLKEFNEGGNFKLPDAYTFLLDEEINIEGSEKYESLSDVPLKVYEVSFDEDNLVPVKKQFVVLNQDTMFIGVWGKIILAKRIE
jgi:hypothetical protein